MNYNNKFEKAIRKQGCNSELIDSIDICDTFISDHCLLSVNTYIPICFTKYHNIVNPPSSIVEMLNFKRCNWLSLHLET